MTSLTLILRSLRFHARAHLGVLLGAAVGSAVLIGALIVGDSVRGSLKDMALARLGRVDFALASGDRLFRDKLAGEIAAASHGRSEQPHLVVPVLQLPGTATAADSSARANRIQVNGVDGRFWDLAGPGASPVEMPDDAVALNAPLARQLGVKPGDTVLLRVPKPAELSRDAPLAKDEDTSVALRLKVHSIVPDHALGRFSLQANQVAPFNAFVPLKPFQNKLEATNRANVLLAARNGKSDKPSRDLSWLHSGLPTALRQSWQLEDAQLELRGAPGGALELRTGRVFLDPPVTEAARRATTNGQLILTYFVNELRVGSNMTPYSMVTATGAPVVPPDMRDDEILINQWLAEDLRAKPGDALSLSYYIVSSGRKLEERTNTFTVRAIVPLAGVAADRTLMPDFPGLANAESCRDWDTGFPIQIDRMRDQDQKYWDDHKGTPKAFVTLAAGQRLWANRFGDATAVRFPAGAERAGLSRTVLENLDPASVGLSFAPVREQALAASAGATDFSGLFVGFSFFLIVAALLLMALLFQFGVEQRATEVGTLLALGFPPASVRRLLLLEGGVLALVGGALGAAGGIAYARAMLWGLSTIWREAIAAAELTFHVTPLTLTVGVTTSSLVAWGTIWLAVRRQARQPARVLLAGAGEEAAAAPSSQSRCRAKWVALAAALAAAAIVGLSLARGDLAAPAFFGAGGLLLVAALASVWALLGALEVREAAARLTVGGLGVRNATRRRRRSIAIAAMLACGSFLVAAIGINRIDAGRDAGKRSAGTGGFALVGETALPVVHDLNAPAGREFFALESNQLAGVSFVPFRVRDGDDASCLNLNRAQRPRLLGVNPRLLTERAAFTFAACADGVPANRPWSALQRGEFYPAPSSGRPLAEDEVAAIGDAASIQWALGKKIGDTIDYTDERGRAFKLRLVGAVANSILQGNLVIDEAEFVKRFPGETGYRWFLVDAPVADAGTVAATLTRALRDVGLELTPATRRLAAFNAVQNTYLSTFQVLGGIGLLLGSIGLGVVVLRNVLERRGELALLLALGFRARAVRWLVVSEHGALLLFGLWSGILAALVAVLPGLLAPDAGRHYASLLVTLAAVFASGALWTWLAALAALRGPLLKALRNE